MSSFLIVGEFGVVPAAIITFIVILISSLIFFFFKKFSTHANTFLIVGLNDAGKTLIFSKLINSGKIYFFVILKYFLENKWVSYTSMKENVYCEYLAKDGNFYSLVDIPGSESLCKSLLHNWFFRVSFFCNFFNFKIMFQERKNIKGIIFVIDSSTFTEKSKDVAVVLYDILYDTSKSIPILIACNKQDNQLKAKSSKVFNLKYIIYF